jgi:RND family efflux transporter MFP subunit
VEGFITRVAVRSGESVSAGAVLFEIDSAPEQAALASLQSMRPMRESDVEFARQQVDRNKTLLTAGAISQREVEQFEAQLRASEAQLKALDDQIRQQRSQLSYYRVTAPIAGTVGDVPVNVGERVTRSTVMTTVDENDFLEVYINVPVQQAPQLKLGLQVRLVDDRGQTLATNPLTFVSPTVDNATQSVLAKARLVDGRGQFRSDQFVRARIVWSTAPGLTVPVTGVMRINAQFFAFVAEKSDQGMIAKQKPVRLGDIIDNEYIVLGGLQPGEQLIVGGLQKIRDGAPVMPAPPPAPTQAPKAPQAP